MTVVLPLPFSLFFLFVCLFKKCSLLLSKHRLLCLLPTVKALGLGLLPDLCLVAARQCLQPSRSHEMARGHALHAGRARCGLAGPVCRPAPWFPMSCGLG